MKTDAKDRRLRFAPPNPVDRPKKAPRRITLTEADYLIFEAINRHGALPSNYLYEFQKHLRKDRTHLQNRLTEFYNGDENGSYLVRPPQQFAGFEARYQHIVYDLAPRAKTALAERGTLARFAPSRNAPFLHQLMQACVGASLELTAASHGLRYISREEILTRRQCRHEKHGTGLLEQNPLAIPFKDGKTKLVPDDLFGLEGKDEKGSWYRFFAVEIDRNTESIERRNLEYNTWSKKVANYSRVLDARLFEDWWGVPNLTVLTATTNATHAGNIIDYIRKNAPKHTSRFAFNVETCFGANWRVPKEVLSKLLDEPWTTLGGVKDISRP